jgi:septum formation protein
MMSAMRLLLASASPRRAELLRAAGFSFETIVVDVDETPRPGEEPSTYVRRLAMEKSARALAVGGGEPVLGADTVVVVDGEILGKPVDDRDAEAMLRRLSGRSHRVLTGLSLRCNGNEAGGVETTDVELMRLSEADVAWYVASGEGRDKAGAYAIQGLASRFIARIEGSYSNVVGLPVHTVFVLLREMV